MAEPTAGSSPAPRGGGFQASPPPTPTQPPHPPLSPPRTTPPRPFVVCFLCVARDPSLRSICCWPTAKQVWEDIWVNIRAFSLENHTHARTHTHARARARATVNSEPPDDAVHAAMNASVQTHRLHLQRRKDRFRTPGTASGAVRARSLTSSPRSIDSNRRGSQIRFVTLTVSQNAHRAGAVERNLITFLQPTHYQP